MAQTKTRRAPAQPHNGVATKEQWAARAVHEVTLYSGAVVKIRIPDLTTLLAGDAVPEELKGIAVGHVISELREATADPAPAGETNVTPESGLSDELLERVTSLHRWLVSKMLVDPQLSPDELRPLEDGGIGLPADDLELLGELAMRRRSRDALGVWLGVEPKSRWSVWQQAHNCPAGCEDCEKVVAEFSTQV